MTSETLTSLFVGWKLYPFVVLWVFLRLNCNSLMDVHDCFWPNFHIQLIPEENDLMLPSLMILVVRNLGCTRAARRHSLAGAIASFDAIVTVLLKLIQRNLWNVPIWCCPHSAECGEPICPPKAEVLACIGFVRTSTPELVCASRRVQCPRERCCTNWSES